MLTTTAGMLTFAASSAAVFLPGSMIIGTVMGSGHYSYPYIYWISYHSPFATGPGTLFKGGGPGSIYVDHAGGGLTTGYAGIKGGPRQFGGTSRLLGKVGQYLFWYGYGQGNVGYLPWLWTQAGASNRAIDDCPVVAGMALYTQCESVIKRQVTLTDGYRNKAYTTDPMGVVEPIQTTTYLYATGFRWTTGTVYVTGPGGLWNTRMTSRGYDNRTSMGSGIIQLVTPHLTNWFGQTYAADSAVIVVLRLAIAPEPKSWLLLGTGGLFLGMLYRLRHR